MPLVGCNLTNVVLLCKNINKVPCNMVLEILRDVEIVDRESRVSRRLYCIIRFNQVHDTRITRYKHPESSSQLPRIRVVFVNFPQPLRSLLCFRFLSIGYKF